MKKILMLSPAGYGDVRIVKIAKYLCSKGYLIDFVGWQRTEKEIPSSQYFKRIVTLQKGGGFGTRQLPFLYMLYIFRLYLHLLLKRDLNSYIIYAINFETACAVWLVSKIRKIRYIYDIFDECAISHNFPKSVESLIRKIDKKIRKSSSFYIHVDENRVSYIDSDNYIILYNSPIDVKENEDVPLYENKFAVTGWLDNTRGLQSIFDFARNNPDITFVVAGEFNQKEFKDKFLSLNNVEYHHFMPQEELFQLISTCRGIFSLYDNSIPINRLAASNKLYDAMMLSIPVIVNKGLVAAESVLKNDTGYIVDYEYGESWNQLMIFDIEKTTKMGFNGRKIYKEKYEFNSMLDNILLPRLESLDSEIHY